MVFPAFFSLNSILLWEADDLSHSQLQVLFLLTVYSFSIFSYKECNQCGFGIDYLLMSMCKVISCVVEKGDLLWRVHSHGRIQLTFAVLHFVPRGQTCLLLQISLFFNISWLPAFAFLSPVINRPSFFFLVLILGDFLGLHGTDQLQFLRHRW